MSPITLYSVLTDGGYWGSGQVVAVTVTPLAPGFNVPGAAQGAFVPLPVKDANHPNAPYVVVSHSPGTPYVSGSGVDTLGR